MTTAQDARTISRCIERCAKAKDGRGRWRAVEDCRQTLAGGALVPSTLDDMCAVSARRIGEWLATVGRTA
jgi:hypothetical protein